MKWCIPSREGVEGGGDEGALAVVGGDGPRVDDCGGAAAQGVVTGGDVHEDQLPCLLGLALDAGQEGAAT